MRRSVLIFALAAGVGACGGADERASSGAPPGSGPAAGPAAKAAATPPAKSAGVDWQDPEPPGAQALAESVLSSPWNQNKSTTLRMSITQLVDRTTGLQGFATTLAAKETSLEDRLAKLGGEVTATEVIIRLSGSVLFDFDSAEIRSDAERTLSEVAAVLAAYAERPIRVEGHTDSIASDAYNQTLSERRAASVAKWLGAHGVVAKRLRSAGFGESKPVGDNATSAGRQQNRRVEIVVEKAG